VFRPALGVNAFVAPDGRLSLCSGVSGEQYGCGCSGAAMWIALQRHGWCVGPAAAELAGEWQRNAEQVRTHMQQWLEELHRAGMVVDEKTGVPERG
jgi:hypothetical protein